MHLSCPECNGEMIGSGYRVLFLTCEECGKTFHVDDCIDEEE